MPEDGSETLRKINMEKVTEQLSQSVSKIGQKLSDNLQTPSTPSKTFNDHQIKSTIYFYNQLKEIYGAKFNTQFPSKESIAISRRAWTEEIGKLRRDQIDYGISTVKQKMIDGNKDFEWPNIPIIIGIANGSYKGDGVCYQHGVIERADRQREEEKLLTLPDTPERISRQQAAGRSFFEDMRELMK